MPEKEKEGYVKKETMMVVAFVALVVGFLGGVLYGSYRAVPAGNAPPADHFHDSAGESSMIGALVKETALHPENVDAWVQLGNLYFDDNQVDKAIEAYQRSLALDPKNANVLTDLGVMYRRKGLPMEAIKSFDRAIAVNQRQEAAYFNKGVVFLHDLKDRDKAIGAWEQLIEINPMARLQSGELVMDLIKNVKENKP